MSPPLFIPQPVPTHQGPHHFNKQSSLPSTPRQSHSIDGYAYVLGRPTRSSTDTTINSPCTTLPRHSTSTNADLGRAEKTLYRNRERHASDPTKRKRIRTLLWLVAVMLVVATLAGLLIWGLMRMGRELGEWMPFADGEGGGRGAGNRTARESGGVALGRVVRRAIGSEKCPFPKPWGVCPPEEGIRGA